jgi:CheY-like chemotaxis protein
MDILLVDDNLLMQQVISRFLHSFGHTVATAEDAEDALTLAAGRVFELLVIDLRLPDMDGDEVLERLRALPGYRSVPAIAISGDGDGYGRRARAAGFDAYMGKPIDFAALEALVATYEARRERAVGG